MSKGRLQESLSPEEVVDIFVSQDGRDFKPLLEKFLEEKDGSLIINHVLDAITKSLLSQKGSSSYHRAMEACAILERYYAKGPGLGYIDEHNIFNKNFRNALGETAFEGDVLFPLPDELYIRAVSQLAEAKLNNQNIIEFYSNPEHMKNILNKMLEMYGNDELKTTAIKAYKALEIFYLQSSEMRKNIEEALGENGKKHIACLNSRSKFDLCAVHLAVVVEEQALKSIDSMYVKMSLK